MPRKVTGQERSDSVQHQTQSAEIAQRTFQAAHYSGSCQDSSHKQDRRWPVDVSLWRPVCLRLPPPVQEVLSWTAINPQAVLPRIETSLSTAYIAQRDSWAFVESVVFTCHGVAGSYRKPYRLVHAYTCRPINTSQQQTCFHSPADSVMVSLYMF